MTIDDILQGLDGEQKDFLANFVETNGANVEKINSLERINADLVGQRAEWRKNVRDLAPEHAQKEIDNLKGQLDEVSTKFEKQQKEYNSELNNLRITSTLKEMGVEAQNMDALNALGSLALESAEYKDGAFVYLNEDGTTRYNDDKKPYSVVDKINELKESEKSYLFKQANGGGFKPGDTPKPEEKKSINDIINAGLKY